MEPEFHVVQTQHGIRNDLGEMTEMQVFAHLQVRLGFDINRANDFMSELEKNASVTFHSEDQQFRLDVHRLNPKCTCTNTGHGHGETCEREAASAVDHLCTKCHELIAAKAMEQIAKHQPVPSTLPSEVSADSQTSGSTLVLPPAHGLPRIV